MKDKVRFELGVDGIWIAKDAVGGKWEWESLCVGMQRPALLEDYTWDKGKKCIYMCQPRIEKTNVPESIALFNNVKNGIHVAPLHLTLSSRED